MKKPALALLSLLCLMAACKLGDAGDQVVVQNEAGAQGQEEQDLQ